MKLIKGCAIAVCLACLLTPVVLAISLWVFMRVNDPFRHPLPPPAPLPASNAFDHYKRAGELVWAADATKPDEKDKPGWTIRPEDAGLGDAGVRHSVLQHNAEALHELRLGFAQPYVLPRDEAMVLVSPYFRNAAGLLRVLRYEAVEHAANGRYAAALDSEMDALRLAVDLERGGQLADRGFVHFALKMSWSDPEVASRVARLDGKSAAAAARRLAKILADEPLPAEGLKTDRELLPTVVRNPVSAADWDAVLKKVVEQQAKEAAKQPELRQKGEQDVAHTVRMDRALLEILGLDPRDMAKWDAAIQHAEAGQRTPPTGQQVAASWEVEARLAAPFLFRSYNAYMEALTAWMASDARGVMPAAPEPETERFGFGATMLGGSERLALDAWWTRRASDEMLLTALALQACRAQRGHYPDTLYALTPDFLDEAPRDPFGQGQNGPGPLQYRREGERFVLYSFGPARQDRGGKPDQTTDAKGRCVHGNYVWGVSTP